MQISAKIVLDSINPYNDKRLTTIEVTFPRLILSETNTHGLIKRNTRSTRAVPTVKLIEEVRKGPYIPVVFRSRKPGMAGGTPLVGKDLESARREWLYGSYAAVKAAENLVALNVAKEHAGRVLEPYLWTTAVWTATHWNNMLALRDTEGAQPEFQILASKIKECLAESVPVYRAVHFPYVDDDQENDTFLDRIPNLIYVSAARCAMVSYSSYESGSDERRDMQLGEKLFQEGHMSPFAHLGLSVEGFDGWSDSFDGWIQVRKMLPYEHDFSLRKSGVS